METCGSVLQSRYSNPLQFLTKVPFSSLLLDFLVILTLFLNTDVSISISFTSSFVGLSFPGWVLCQQGRHRDRWHGLGSGCKFESGGWWWSRFPDCLSLPQSKTPPRKNNWKQKHEALIHILSQARQVQQIPAKGRKVSDLPPLPPTENPDYVACTYCGRKFAPRVAERHIPKCKNIKNRPPPPPQRRCWSGSAQLYLLCDSLPAFCQIPSYRYLFSVVSTLAASFYVQQVNSSGWISWITELVYFDLHPRLPHKRCPFPQHKKLRIRNSRGYKS